MADEPSPLRIAEQSLQAKKFGKAIEMLDKHLADGDSDQTDYATYLKALAQFHQDDDDAVVKTCDSLAEKFGDSDWLRKSLFLKSRSLVRQKKFEEAEKIYEAEATRLFSADRKEGLARILVEFGDELARKPDEQELDATPADFNKAVQLYNKALALEIGRELEDEVQFKLARCYQELSQWPNAEQRYQNYLKEFDPLWSGPVGSQERFRGQLRENPLPAGKHWRDARFHLIEVQLAQCGQTKSKVNGQQHYEVVVPTDPSGKLGKFQQARQNAEDLLALLDVVKEAGAYKALRSDTHWLLVRSYNLPHPVKNEFDKGIFEARRFLKMNPTHPRATDTSRNIAMTYRNAGQTDNAIAAYRDFAAAKNFTFVPEDEEQDPEIKTGVSCDETFNKWTQESVYMIGQLFYEQKKYDEAINQWRQYIARFPNGAQWSQCQSGIINAEFQVGIDAVAARDFGRAETHFDKFLQDHPLDERARQILFTLGQIQFALAEELDEKNESPDEETAREIKNLYRKSITQWERLVSKYPSTQESILALYRMGVIQEEKLGDLEQALVTYQRSNNPQARQRYATLTTHSLNASTKRTFRTNEDAYIEVTSRNAPKLKLNQYFLNLEAYFRKTHGINGIDGLDIDLIEPDKTWEIDIPDFEKYKLTTQRIKIPFDEGKPGVCIIKVAEDDFEATTLVIRSDIDIITKTSRREVLVFAQNRLTNEPAAGVKVIASDGETVFGNGVTGDDGVFRKEFFEELKESNTVRIFAASEQGTASYNLNLNGLRFSTGLSPRGYIHTEKPAYRPGETVNIRGILRDVKDGSYVIAKDTEYDVRVLDPKGRMLSQTTHKLSDFGAIDTALTIDSEAPVGKYTITISETDTSNATVFNGSFEVQRYKLEKVKLAFDFEKKVLFGGEKVNATLKASYYWGTPAAGEMVDYVLPDGRTYSARTDEAGEIQIEFDPSGFQPGRQLKFSANAKQYNVAAADYVFLAELGFSTKVDVSQDVALAGEPFDVTLKTTDADGEPVGKELTLYVLRREAPKADKILSAVPWISQPTKSTGEVTVEEHKITTDDKTGKAVKQLKLEKGGIYTLRVSGEDRFEQIVTAEGQIRVSDDKDKTKLRFFADNSTGKVGAELPVRLHSRVDNTLALLTIEGENILTHKVLTLKSGFNPVGFVLDHKHYPNFRIAIAAIDQRDLQHAHKDISVERELQVKITPRQEIEVPGAEGSVDIVVTDQNGDPVEAALSVSLVKEALYSLYPEQVPDILDFFQSGARRYTEFRIGSTCGFEYQGVSRPVVKSITEEAERLERKKSEVEQLQRFQSKNAMRYGNDAYDDFGENDSLGGTLNRSAGDGMGYGGRENAGAAAPNVSDDPFAAADKYDGQQEGEDGKPAAEPRKEVMSASRWVAPVITDASGKATITIPLPESTTQWRLTARGCSKETLVGQATASLITRKDFFIELKTPVQLQEGDSMRFLAKLHNLTNFEGKVDVSLQLDDQEQQTVTVDVKKYLVTECLFDEQQIPLVKTLTLTATAQAGDAADKLVVELPVRPWGLPYVVSAGGTSTGNASGILALPKGVDPSWRELQITISPSIEQALVDLAINSGGTSVQADDLLASVAALDYAVAHKGRDEDIRELRKRVNRLVASLTSTQLDDGSWQWRGKADWYSTCRSYWALARASKSGSELQPDLLQKTEAFLKNYYGKLGTKNNEAKTVILHALSVTGKADFANLNRIYRERAGLSSNALARSAVAMINLKRNDFAKELVELLEKKVKLEKSDGADDEKSQRASWDGSGEEALQDRRETTAMVLLALVGTKPNSPLCQQAANTLLQGQGCLRYNAPTSLGPTVAALSAFYNKVQDEKADFELTVFVNNEKVATVKSDDLDSGKTIDVPAKFLEGEKQTVRIEKQGPGTFHYSAVMTAFSPTMKDPNPWKNDQRLLGSSYYHDRLTYRGVPLSSNSTSRVTKVELGQKIHVYSNTRSYSRGEKNFRVRKEFLPAGMLLVEGSLNGNFQHHEVGDGEITMYYRPGSDLGRIDYELVAYAPGTYRVLPGIVRDVYMPNRFTIGKPHTITVLGPDEDSDDSYAMNTSEHLELGKLKYHDNNYDEALTHLEYLFKSHRKSYERHVAPMLLWIYATEEHFNAEQVVEMFEILRERHPDLTIPFDKILAVGKAYRMIGEHERAWLVFRATIDSSFINDASLSAILEDQGQFLGGLEYMDNIWREYPDTADVVSAYFAISQQLYDKAPAADELKAEIERRRKRLGEDANQESDFDSITDRIGLLNRSLEYLDSFLTLYPTDPLSDDAAFSMANAFFAMKDYSMVVKSTERFYKRYPESEFASSFQYMAALGHFWQLHYDEALASAAPVAEGKSKDRDYARYITAQIHHAQGEPQEAIDWYSKVKNLYPDAKDAIAYFEEEKISLEEVTTFKPGEKVELAISYRNIKEANLQVYKVDLMKLYLREKNLSKITEVHLAGIEPESELKLDLGDGKDYRDREKTATLPLTEEGAYLVICRGDNLFTSGMVLVTPLKLEIQESPAEGSLRVNVRDTIDQGYQANVHVKAIGTADDQFKSGDTDLRGIFVAQGINGNATVIARQDGRYAFYRGDTHLGQKTAQAAQQMKQLEKAQRYRMNDSDFLNNIDIGNKKVQQQNIDYFDSLRRGGGGKGVQVQEAY